MGSYMVRYPLGGNLSWALQYLTGLRDLGHDVYVVEKYVHADSCYDPVQQVMTNDCTYGVQTVSELLGRFDLKDHWCFVSHDQEYYGMSKNKITEIFERANLYIENGSHGAWAEEVASSNAVSAYIDVDPAFTQMNFYRQLLKGNSIPVFDFYFTNGMNIGIPGNIIPTCNIDWKFIYNPVNVKLFEPAPPSQRAPYSTIMNWKSYAENAMYNGVSYGHKDLEFEKFLRLPVLVSAPMEIALSSTPPGKKKELTEQGWLLKNAQQVTFTYDLFKDYLLSCKGEFSVAKNMYVATDSGWFSDKSAAFLASGRPVILQDTGFSRYLPVGEGLFGVKNVDEAREAIESIEGNFKLHSNKAREIACDYLDTGKVLEGFLNVVGVN